MSTAEDIIGAFCDWFEGSGFRCQSDYSDEESLKRDLATQVDSWVEHNFPGWRAKLIPKGAKAPVLGPFAYGYVADAELYSVRGELVPVEAKLMKVGYEPNQAIGQAIMLSRRPDTGQAIAAIVDSRKSVPPYGSVEQSLRKDLWEKLRVRLCVRKA